MAARHQSRPQLSSSRISTHPIFLNLITGNQVEKINLGQNPVHEQLQPSCLLKLTSDHPTPRLKPLWGLGIEFQRHLVAWKVLQDQPTPLTPAGTSFPPRPVAVRSRYPALWSIFSVLHGCGGVFLHPRYSLPRTLLRCLELPRTSQLAFTAPRRHSHGSPRRNHTARAGNCHPWVSHYDTHPENEGLCGLCSRLDFQECLHYEQSWKWETLIPLEQRARWFLAWT